MERQGETWRQEITTDIGMVLNINKGKANRDTNKDGGKNMIRIIIIARRIRTGARTRDL